MKGFWAITVLLLLLSVTAFAQESAEDPVITSTNPTTEPETPSTSVAPSTGDTTTDDKSPKPTSSTTESTDATSTSDNGETHSTTSEGTTIPPTTHTTTPPQVNVSRAGVTMNCENARCTFSLKAPTLTKAFINSENLLIYNETADVNFWEMNVTNFEKEKKLQSYRTKTNELLQKIQKTKDLIAAMKEAVANMNREHETVEQSLYTVNQIVKIFRGELSSCYYKACLQPPTTTTTTTTTAPPTTTEDPCLSTNCTDYGTCSSATGQAVCTCTGNLGSARNCDTSTCAFPATGPQLLKDNSTALVVSPGFFWNSNETQPEYYNASKCQWIITVLPGQKLEVDVDGTVPFNVSNLGANTVLWEGDPGSQYKIVQTTKSKYLNSAMSLTTGTKHTFTLDGTASNGAPFSFGFTLKVVPPAAALQEEEPRYKGSALELPDEPMKRGELLEVEEPSTGSKILKWLGF